MFLFPFPCVLYFYLNDSRFIVFLCSFVYSLFSWWHSLGALGVDPGRRFCLGSEVYLTLRDSNHFKGPYQRTVRICKSLNFKTGQSNSHPIDFSFKTRATMCLNGQSYMLGSWLVGRTFVWFFMASNGLGRRFRGASGSFAFSHCV